MTCFYAIRHGETDWNVKGLLQGSMDIPLNANGLQQAEKAAIEFAQAGITRIITSPKERCLQTMHALLNGQTIPYEIEDNLVERSFGPYEGKSRDSVTKGEGISIPDLPGVEPWEDVKTRATHAVMTGLTRYPTDILCFVTHGGVITGLSEQLCGEKSKTPNSTLIRFDQKGHSWSRTIITRQTSVQPIMKQQTGLSQ